MMDEDSESNYYYNSTDDDEDDLEVPLKKFVSFEGFKTQNIHFLAFPGRQYKM